MSVGLINILFFNLKKNSMSHIRFLEKEVINFGQNYQKNLSQTKVLKITFL